jgi:hypothetical protein
VISEQTIKRIKSVKSLPLIPFLKEIHYRIYSLTTILIYAFSFSKSIMLPFCKKVYKMTGITQQKQNIRAKNTAFSKIGN